MLNPGGIAHAATSYAGNLRIKFAKLRSNGFIRNAGIITSGSALGHIFTLAAGPLLTRIYGPEEFGALGLFTSALSIMVVAVTLQY